ncbi:MAG: tRNA (adenosine(37)-N6)-threonylcarbamoyltransferase complex dimerization subunit type 1 TsaB [Anaerolineales bacterium]
MLLAVDTSSRIIGVALYDGLRVLGETVWASDDYHTVELAPAVAETVARAGYQIKDLQAVAVATGPGSFTGLRIGLALAKGLALARHLPMIGVRSLDVLAAAQPVRDMPLVATLQIGRGRLAAGWYEARSGTWRPTGEISVVTAEALAEAINHPTMVSGEMTSEERRILSRKKKNVILASPAHSMRRPSFLAELAWQRWQAGQIDDPVTLSPFYLQLKDPIPG